jgi:hypothetical protein
MSDESTHPSDVVTTLTSAEALLGEPAAAVDEGLVAQVIALLRDIERATPNGAGLHAQLDTVAKWVTLLSVSAEHQRFGGSDQVRGHVATQFRLARAAAEDYLRATG